MGKHQKHYTPHTQNKHLCSAGFYFFPAREYMELHWYFSKRHNQESMFFA